MYPTWQEIERAAYERWERRGWVHGADRDDWAAAEMDLKFQKNYRPAAEYPLQASDRIVIGARPRPSCRFCERSGPKARFTEPRPIVPAVVGPTSLYSGEICDECHEQFESTIDRDFAAFWESLAASTNGPDRSAPTSVSIGAYKALVRMAISIMPARELGHFVDTVEWVGNPDHDFDSSLFSGTGCLVYSAYTPHTIPWMSLSRRTDPDAPLPYAVFILVSGVHVIEIAPPLCERDQEHDDPRSFQLPRRSFTTGYGQAMRTAACRLLPLERSDRPRKRGARLFA